MDDSSLCLRTLPLGQSTFNEPFEGPVGLQLTLEVNPVLCRLKPNHKVSVNFRFQINATPFAVSLR